MSNILDKIVQIDFPKDQYYQEETKKTMIFLHHTVSPRNSAQNVAVWWASNREHVSTQIVLNGDGIPYQLYSSKFWSYHLGSDSQIFRTHGVPYKNLDKISIAVEICSWGCLVQDTDKKWYPVKYDSKLKKVVPYKGAGVIPNDQVHVFDEPFRGMTGFHKYSTEQIETLKELLIYWGDRWSIPLDYHPEMWDVSVDCLKGTPGIWSHTSVRSDKSDIFPQPEMVTMLQSLV